MRYVELEGNRVRFVLPAKLAGDYKVLPPKAVEIPLDADVQEGDVYDPKAKGFTRPTEEELKEAARPGFNTMRDYRFRETEWVRQRHNDRKALGTDSTTNWQAWLDYWQALRDMPEKKDFDPRNPVWPQKPKEE